MGLLDFLRRPDINEGVRRWEQTPHAVLRDVRTPAEFREGHIPGSRNLPVDEIRRTPGLLTDQAAPLFVYCASGARSRMAVSALRRMGYQNVTNIGGIIGYHGKVEN